MKDSVAGLCRVSAKKPEERLQVKADESCEKWRDAGQTYYIRLGWIKAHAQKESQGV
jgi:hypothetical protein